MDNLIILIVATLISAVGGLIAIVVARAKGLPDINREIEARMVTLNDTLDEQLKLANDKIDALSNDFNECKTRLASALSENDRLIRRLRLAEGDLLALYQGQGREAPYRLTHPTNGEGKQSD